jgi:protein-S-isoprenylcysteine O-methyltransferase Ste14
MSPRLHLRVPPVAVTFLAGAVALVNVWAFPGLCWESPARPWLALILVLAGIICGLLGVASFRSARTSVNPLQPAAATTLVISGIYRVSRNPMYLGFLFLLLGELAWLAHPFALLAAPALVIYLNCFQIAPEEQALRQSFGMEYMVYATRVRRWI